MRVGAIAVGALIALLLTACGSSGPSAAEKREAAERRAKAHALAVAKKCQGQVGGFLSSLNELDSRLTVGLNYSDYLNEVGNVTVVYNKIPIGQMDAACLGSVGVVSEKALRQYTDAAEIWQECFENFECELQSDWSAATSLISRARRGMAELRTP